MSDKPIEKMTFEELRNEVRLLSDSLAKMKRFYEDAFYNLDDGNFSKTIIKEKNGMKAQIRVNEKEISTKVSSTDLSTTLLSYSTISQTSEAITSTVSKEYITDKVDDEYETKSDANTKLTTVRSEIQQSASQIRLSVIKDIDKQSAVSVSSTADMTDISKIYECSGAYYYFDADTNTWTPFTDSIYSVFTQTASGFNMKGNVVIDGNTVITRNLRLSGNVTWDMTNSPVQTQYSSDGSVWHQDFVSGVDNYMRMSFDGGNTWSNPVKVVGTDGQDGQDGQDGRDGSDASVTPQNVFNALTNNGAQQGIFAAFVKNNNRIYINSEYLATRIATVADTLFIGNTTANGTRRIILTGSSNSPSAYIMTADDGVGGNGGLKLSSALNHLEGHTRIEGLLDLSSQSCSVNWGNIGVPAVFG